RIATHTTLQKEEKIREEKKVAEQTLKEQQKALEPLFTEYIAISYSNAQTEIQPHLEKIMTKDRGTVSVDTRTNMVIMTDTAAKIRQAKEIVDKLDRVTPQVIIEARIVEATASFSKEIGTSWGMSSGLTDTTVAAGALAQPGRGPQRSYDLLGGTYGYDLAMNSPLGSSIIAKSADGSAAALGFNFLRIAGSPLVLNAKLAAMESQGKGKIISAPKIATLDNKKALIKQGLRYPYQTVDDGKISKKFEDVTLNLEVTPHVTPDNRISLTVMIKKNDIGDIIGGEQSFMTKEANTELLVNDGETVVIGGIIKSQEDRGSDGIPGLSQIPLLGWFFKAKSNKDSKDELLIFITPRIVQLEQRQIRY
ncbi:MAG: type IV pilus secretin PilQ, partial [Burkholderiales bacterium]